MDRTRTDRRPSLDPDVESMRRLGYLAVDQIVEHLGSLSSRRVSRRRTRADLAYIDEPLTDDPIPIEESLQFFFDRVVPEMTQVNHPRFHGHIPCPSSFPGALGQMLAAGTNPFVGSWLGSGSLSALELTVIRWIAELIGYPTSAAGILVSGGSMANLVGLAAARARSASDGSSQGIIYVSREGHGSVQKAARLLGFSTDAVREIGVDDQLQIDVNELERCILRDRADGQTPVAVAANAGTTNSGAIDPLLRIAEVCRTYGLWLHVDGAYGGLAAVTEEGRQLLRGMDQADSLTLDPHKWLYSPMGTGCVLVREPDDLTRAFATEGHYLKDLEQGEVQFMDRGPELSRPARAIGVWMVLRSAGRRQLQEQIATDIRLARLAAQLLREDDRFEVNDPTLSVITFRHRARDGEEEAERAARDDRLMERTLASGNLMLSTTVIGGRSTVRLVVMNHRTTEEDVRFSVQCIRETPT